MNLFEPVPTNSFWVLEMELGSYVVIRGNAIIYITM